MKLFTRKMRMFCVSNIMVSFVCTGFLGINGIANNIESTTNEAHEISLTSSDTEPVSQYGEGDVERLAFIPNSLKAGISQQESATLLKIKGIENTYAVVTKSVGPVFQQQEKILAEKKEKVETKNTSKKTTTSVVKKKEVAHSSSYKKPSYSAVTGEAIVAFAKQFMGLRYKGGTPSLTNGADCSGFTMLIFREFGVNLSRSVEGQINAGKYVAKGDLQKGDLVFYRNGSGGGHVTIYIGGNTVIHESRPGVGVKTSPLNMNNMKYVTARRVINSTSVKIAEQKLEQEKKNENVTDTASTNNNTIVNSDNNVNNDINNVVTETNTTNSATTTETPKEAVVSTPSVPVVTPESSTQGEESN